MKNIFRPEALPFVSGIFTGLGIAVFFLLPSVAHAEAPEIPADVRAYYETQQELALEAIEHAKRQQEAAIAKAEREVQRYQQMADYKKQVQSLKQEALYVKAKAEGFERENEKLWTLINNHNGCKQ